MLSRSSFKAELVAYRASLRPPKVPGARGPDGLGNRSSATLDLLDRWIAEERTEEVWKKIASIDGLSALDLIRTVIRARYSAQASVNRVYGAKWKGGNFPGWAGALANLKKRVVAELSKSAAAISPADVVEIFERAADEARDFHAMLFEHFSDHLGLPGRPKFVMSRKDQAGTRVRNLFIQIVGEFLMSKVGQRLNDEVAVLTEIAFPGKALDREHVISARKATTSGRRLRVH
jgi:hypothetical protein